MREALLCPQCEKTIPADAPQGLCPACMTPSSDVADVQTIAPGANAVPVATPPLPPIHVTCACGKLLKIRAELQGKRLKCPACGVHLDVNVAPSVQEAATMPPQSPARPGEETVAPPDSGFSTQPASSPSGATPVDFPGYEILGELGRGGMGVVYKARDKKLGRLVALKMILSGGHAGTADLARFRTEAEAIARIKHANIIQIYEIGEHEGKPYFSLEFCAGGSLAQKIDGTPMLPKDAARLVEKLARGMEAAHQEDVIHRDLKPANVLLSPLSSEGEGSGVRGFGTPKITDFGLAKKLDDAGQTQSGAIMGTPSYMAPEQAGDKTKKMGPATDIYALGAILYELLTGRPPFKAATSLDTILQVVAEDPVPPSQLQHKTPRDLETICLKCLQKDPAKRYATAAALADDLGRYINGEPIQARPVGNAERVTKWVKRRPMVAGLLAAVALFAFIAFAGISGGMGWALVERENAIDQEKKTSLALKDTEKARKQSDEDRKKAEAEKTIAEKAREEADTARSQAEAATKEMKKQLRRAETLVVQVKFEHAFREPEENRPFSMLSTAGLLREAIALEDRPLQDSIRLHLGSWTEQVHRLTSILLGKTKFDFSVVAFSPDGKTVLTGNFDSTAQLWETATGQPLGPPMNHEDVVLAAAFSPDGKTVLTGSGQMFKRGEGRLWDAATGKPRGPRLQHQGSVSAVVFSPDGKTIVTASWDKTARLWEAASGQPLGSPLQHKGEVYGVAFSPDGKSVLTGSLDGTARIWEAATGKSLGPSFQHFGIQSVAFSPDGKSVLTGGRDYLARLWEADTGKPLGQPLQCGQAVDAVGFSPDGKIILTRVGGGRPAVVRLWETATYKPLASFQHQREITAVAFSLDGKTVLTGGDDETARLWMAATGKPIGPPLRHQGRVSGVAFSLDGKTVLTRTANKVHLWKTARSQKLEPPLEHQGPVDAVAFSPDGKHVLTGSLDKTARLWDAATGKPLGLPLQHQDWVQAVAFSPDGKTVLTGSQDKTARLWETATGKQLGPTLQHQGMVFAVAFSPDGKAVITGSDTARLWETATARPFGPPLAHQGNITRVAFSPDGKIVLTGSMNKTVRLFETATGKPFGPSLLVGGNVTGVAFNPDGKTVLTCSETGPAQLWAVATGKPLGPPMPHQGGIFFVSFSPDGKTVLTGSSDKTARLWDTATGKPFGPPLEHAHTVWCGSFSPDGKTVLTGSWDQTGRLWEAATGKPLGLPLQHQERLGVVAFSPDGKTLLTGSYDTTAQRWQAPRPIQGDPERILLWTQVITGMELNDQGQVRVLDVATWHARRQQLEKLGGPPVP